MPLNALITTIDIAAVVVDGAATTTSATTSSSTTHHGYYCHGRFVTVIDKTHLLHKLLVFITLYLIQYL